MIVAAAIQHDSGVVTLPPPARHHTLIAHMTKEGLDPRGSTQGFITDDGRFVDRKEAAQIAYENDQIPREGGPRPCAPGGRLYSEDVW